MLGMASRLSKHVAKKVLETYFQTFLCRRMVKKTTQGSVKDSKQGADDELSKSPGKIRA
jgi:hypothetical protein